MRKEHTKIQNIKKEKKEEAKKGEGRGWKRRVKDKTEIENRKKERSENRKEEEEERNKREREDDGNKE